MSRIIDIHDHPQLKHLNANAFCMEYIRPCWLFGLLQYLYSGFALAIMDFKKSSFPWV